ncbi:MAG: nitrous oxide reductase family maturation protein NosD [Candidatus Hodarchaeota archaeon]
MKSNRKRKSIILIILGILFALSPIITTNINFKNSELSDSINLDDEDLKISKVSGKIHIDNNWTDARDAGICTGTGSYSDPYIIEDLVIDANSSGSCILIENSDAYFKIENCTVYNSGSTDYMDAGINLYNCSNGLLINNNCSFNYKGISLINCVENEISNNIANNNIRNGIYLANCDNNIVSGNIVNNNYETGIRIGYSYHNEVSGNTANNNRDRGIYLYSSGNNDISSNNITNNWNGIYLFKSNDTIVSGNTVTSNANGIAVRESYNNDISENTASSNERGILVALSSDYNTISKNKANDNDYGIMLGVCFNNILLENNAFNNDYGIYLAGSFYATISGNIVNSNWFYGIYLEVSLNSTVTENIVYYNWYGISIDENSISNTIYLNCFNNTLNARDNGLNNSWDNGIKGNFWGDYNGTDLNNNGIGDTPYNITGSAGSQDNFPLMICPLPLEKPKGGLPMELIIIISVISGGAVIGIATILLIRRKRKRIE